jgi:predicted transcriptional regulator
MFSWFKKLFRKEGRSAGEPAAVRADSNVQKRLDALFAELEQQSNRLVENAVANFEKSWRITDK